MAIVDSFKRKEREEKAEAARRAADRRRAEDHQAAAVNLWSVISAAPKINLNFPYVFKYAYSNYVIPIYFEPN